MPNRIVREGINDSRAFALLSDSGEIFYRRLMNVVDDFGRYEADPELLRVKCFPRLLKRWPVERVQQALSEVSNTPNEDGYPLVLVYSVGTKQYLEIANFNQRLRAKKAHYPEPTVRQLIDKRRAEDGHRTDICPSSDGHMTDTRRQSGDDDFSSLRFSSVSNSDINNGKSKPPSGRFEEFWERYPVKEQKDLVCGVWIGLVTKENEAKVFACLDRYLASDRGRRSPKNANNWLHDCARDDWNSDWPVAPVIRKQSAAEAMCDRAREILNREA